MALPGVTVTVRDGGLGIVPPGTAGQFVKVGPSPIGVINTVYSAADNSSLTKQLGNGGPIVEAGGLALAVGGQGPVRPNGLLFVPVNPSTYGTASAVTHVGSGAGTLTVAIKPSNAFLIKCIAGGSSTTSTWQTSLDGGITWGATWTAAATIIVPGVSFTTLAFGAGTAVTGDVVTVPASNTAPSLQSGSGTLVPTISAACPVDAYSVIVTITVGGALGVATFTYSLDGGNTTSQPILTPGSGIYAILDGNDPNKSGSCATGLVLTFTSTFVAGDTYSFTTTTASYSGSDLTSAMTALQADTRFGSGIGVHVVGAASTSANAATLLATLDTLMGTAAGAYKFDRAMIENPQDTDSSILSAYAASSSLRVGAAAGFHSVTSTINGRIQNRNAAWSVMARAGCINPAEDPARVNTGSLPGVTKIVRDESQTPGLDAGRFTTLTTIPGRNGFYVTNGRLMSPPGSDFTYWQYGRVMDLVSFLARQALLNFLNDSIRVNSDGTIAEKDARRIEQFVSGYILNGLPGGSISSLSVVVSRTNNVLSTQTILPTIRAVPLGYAKFINADVGFTNQALVVKAA